MKTKNSLLPNVLKILSVVSIIFLFSCTKVPVLTEPIQNVPVAATPKASVQPLAPCFKDFNRYWSSNYTDHYYTTGTGPFQFYTFEKVECWIFDCTGPINVPLYQYYNVTQRDHYYTRTQSNYAGYVYEQIVGYVRASSTYGEVPLYQFYSPTQTDHFYTVTYGTYAGYTYEGVVGYVISIAN